MEVHSQANAVLYKTSIEQWAKKHNFNHHGMGTVDVRLLSEPDKAEMLELFQVMDSAGRGYLDISNLEKVADTVLGAGNYKAQNLRDAMGDLEQNKEGKVTWQGFCVFYVTARSAMSKLRRASVVLAQQSMPVMVHGHMTLLDMLKAYRRRVIMEQTLKGSSTGKLLLGKLVEDRCRSSGSKTSAADDDYDDDVDGYNYSAGSFMYRDGDNLIQKPAVPDRDGANRARVSRPRPAPILLTPVAPLQPRELSGREPDSPLSPAARKAARAPKPPKPKAKTSFGPFVVDRSSLSLFRTEDLLCDTRCESLSGLPSPKNEVAAGPRSPMASNGLFPSLSKPANISNLRLTIPDSAVDASYAGGDRVFAGTEPQPCSSPYQSAKGLPAQQLFPAIPHTMAGSQDRTSGFKSSHSVTAVIFPAIAPSPGDSPLYKGSTSPTSMNVKGPSLKGQTKMLDSMGSVGLMSPTPMRSTFSGIPTYELDRSHERSSREQGLLVPRSSLPAAAFRPQADGAVRGGELVSQHHLRQGDGRDLQG